jgi:hypothetical protein
MAFTCASVMRVRVVSVDNVDTVDGWFVCSFFGGASACGGGGGGGGEDETEEEVMKVVGFATAARYTPAGVVGKVSVSVMVWTTVTVTSLGSAETRAEENSKNARECMARV